MKQHLVNYYRRLTATNILSNFFNLSSIQLSNLLLIVLIIPIVARAIGMAEYGAIMFASRFAQLSGTVVNYGTSQSGVMDTALHLKAPQKLGIVFYNTIIIRIIIFIIFLVIVVAMRWFNIPYYNYILLAIPIALAEVFNPICFFIGIEKLKLFNIYNLVSNAVCIIALLMFIKGPENAGWVNFILGMANAITYLGLLIYFGLIFNLSYSTPLKSDILKIGKDNFYLSVNNISVNLQQSIIIFALPRWGKAFLLGPYTLCDRIIGQCRNLLITIASAIYPRAVHLYKESGALWNAYRRKTKYILAGVFFTGGIFLFILADFIVFILTKQHDQTTVLLLRIMAFVPAVSSLNVLNGIDQLLKGNNIYIFKIAAVLFAVSILVAAVLLNWAHPLAIGTFTLIVEGSAWFMYEYIVKKTSVKNA